MSGRDRGDWNPDAKVYIGNLPDRASKIDVETAFEKYGHLKNVWVARNPPGFAFVEYDDARDAEDAVRGLDGTKIAGGRVRVEMSHGRSRGRNSGPSRDRGYKARRYSPEYRRREPNSPPRKRRSRSPRTPSPRTPSMPRRRSRSPVSPSSYRRRP